MCLRGLKQYDKALEELENCEKITGENDAISTLKAQLLMDKGDKETAQAIAETLKEKDFVYVTATIRAATLPEVEGPVPFLIAEEVVSAEPPVEEVVMFN